MMFGHDQPVFSFRGIFGVPVEVRQSAIMLLFIYAAITIMHRGSLGWLIAIEAGLVLSVYLHELGHAFGALVQGVRVDRIALHGFGGFCRHASAPWRKSEFIVVMGPLVNVVLWAVCGLMQHWIVYSVNDPRLIPVAYPVMQWFGMMSNINLFLAMLNLIPVFPLDGGHLLHFVLRRIFEPSRAWWLSGVIGLTICVLWIPAMFYGYYSYGLLLLFVPSFAYHLAIVQGRLRG